MLIEKDRHLLAKGESRLKEDNKEEHVDEEKVVLEVISKQLTFYFRLSRLYGARLIEVIRKINATGRTGNLRVKEESKYGNVGEVDDDVH